MNNKSICNIDRFEDIVSETNPVAMIRRQPAQLSQSNNLKFQESYDDLDYLSFAILPLPSKNQICLVHRLHSPESGIEICVSQEQANIPRILTEALWELNLTRNDLIWIHQEYEQKLYELIEKQDLSKFYS